MIPSKLFCTALKFVAAAASVNDVRYYLNGVRFEFIDDTLTLIGTDGNRLHVAKLQLEHGIPGPDVAAIVRNASVKQILTTVGKDKNSVMLDAARGEGEKPAKVTVTAGGIVLTPEVEPGNYPEWRRIVPAARESGPMPHLDATQLAQACAGLVPLAAAYKKTNALTFGSTGKDMDTVVVRPARIADPRVLDVFAVIAPIRK